METLLKDIRYGVRTLMKQPGFLLVAIVTLALGIAANTAIFTVVDAVLLRPLPYPEPERLVMAWENHQALGGPEREWLSPAGFDDWRTQNTVFEHLSAVGGWGPTLSREDESQQLVGAVVSHDTLSLLGVPLLLGRGFTESEDQPGAERVVVLSHSLWQRYFNSNPDITGTTVSLSGEQYTVIGVMPAGFKLPIIPNSELWSTLRPTLNPGCQRGCYVLRVLGRLKHGVTVAGAQSEMVTIAGRLAEQFPETNQNVSATIVSLHEQTVGPLRPAMLMLLVAVGFVLLIACANVANLMLARGVTRRKELAIRAALGAGRRRVIRQLLTEASLLAVAGGALGVLLAFWLVQWLVAIGPQGTPRLDEISIDTRVLGFTIGTTLLTGIIFGLVPALQLSKLDLSHSLKETARTSQSGGGRLRNALVVAEIALALILLIGGGLLMKSFLFLQRVDPGFNPTQVLTLGFILNRNSYPERPQMVSFYSQLLERVETLPGVQSAGLVSTLPLSGSNTDTSFAIEGRPAPPPNQEPVAWYSSVSHDYFRTMDIRPIKGRLFSENDNEKAPRVVVIAEALARRYWPDEDPIGKRIGSAPDNWREIVGVVSDVKHFGLDVSARPSMYLPASQSPSRGMTLVVKATGKPSGLIGVVRSEVRSLDSNLALTNIKPMDQIVTESIAQPRFILLLLGVFAGLALMLAAVGIYGVISYAVTQRTQEFGVRMALGARAFDVLSLVLKRGMALALLGVALGLAGSFALTRLMTQLLFGVTPTDALTFGAVSVFLLVVALIACYVPARRATKVDPLVALRYE